MGKATIKFKECYDAGSKNAMTQGLIRKHTRGDFHFITFSCDQRRPYLNTPASRELVEDAVEMARIRYECFIAGYVIMPEHVHLIISEPYARPFASMIQGIKVAVSKRSREKPFWLACYYDFNIFTEEKRVEKLRYIHRNPVTRGLVAKPEDWQWSSFRHYAFGEELRVEIESDWTAARRNRAGTNPP